MDDGLTPEQRDGLTRTPSGAAFAPAWRRTVAWVVGAVALAYLAFGTYRGDGWVFPFSQVDLGFHELGHMLTMVWAPQPVVSLAGSFTEVAVPLGLAAYFLFVRRELFSGALMVGWAGEALNGVGIYIFDATRRVLPLLGSQAGHDWAYLLGPGVFDALEHTDTIAMVVKAGSVILFLAAFALIGWGFARPRLADRAASRLEAHRATLPVRDVPRRRRDM